MFLDPAKLLVILIVALVVLGPDKLPTVARQMGAAWGEIRRFRERLETEVRGTFPDLPSTHQVAQAVRSPLAFLDQLADAHEREQQQAGEPPPDQSVVTDDPDRALSMKPSVPVTTGENGKEASPARTPPDRVAPDVPGPVPARTNGNVGSPPRQVGRTRPWRGSDPAETAFIPDDPSMN